MACLHFIGDPTDTRPETIYAFVMTMEASKMPRFFVMRGQELLDQEEALWGKYGRRYEHKHGRGVRPKVLESWENNWPVIDK